jgi:hypothetical protein
MRCKGDELGREMINEERYDPYHSPHDKALKSGYLIENGLLIYGAF